MQFCRRPADAGDWSETPPCDKAALAKVTKPLSLCLSLMAVQFGSGTVLSEDKADEDQPTLAETEPHLLDHEIFFPADNLDRNTPSGAGKGWTRKVPYWEWLQVHRNNELFTEPIKHLWSHSSGAASDGSIESRITTVHLSFCMPLSCIITWEAEFDADPCAQLTQIQRHLE